jgi:hypothetical protein
MSVAHAIDGLMPHLVMAPVLLPMLAAAPCCCWATRAGR